MYFGTLHYYIPFEKAHTVMIWYERLYITKEFINKYKISDKVTDKLSEIW